MVRSIKRRDVNRSVDKTADADTHVAFFEMADHHPKPQDTYQNSGRSIHFKATKRCCPQTLCSDCISLFKSIAGLTARLLEGNLKLMT